MKRREYLTNIGKVRKSGAIKHTFATTFLLPTIGYCEKDFNNNLINVYIDEDLETPTLVLVIDINTFFTDDMLKRLEKNQKRIIEVFNSEIKLLQSAFNEMRSIYKPQIENQKNEKKREFISLQEFFTILKRASKSDLEIKNTILNCVKNGDKRFIYNKNSKKLLILNDSFEDLL